MVDTTTTDLANNPSQNGGPGITLAPPVNGSATPDNAPAVDESDPVAVAKAAYDKAVADAAAKAGTPAEPAKPDDKPAEPKTPQVDNVPSQTEDGVVTYDETGDAGLDFALAFIGSLGIEGTDPTMVAAANGDFSLLEAKLASLGDKAKGWEKYVAVGKQAFERQANVYKETQTKSLEQVHKIAGGKEQWDALVAWSASVASPEEKEVLNSLFDAGPTQAAMAARMLVAAHAEAKGTVKTPANPAANASGNAPQEKRGTTTADYYKEVDQLYRKLGNSMDGSKEYADLKRRYFG